jgi:hypothetical protein
MTLRRLASLIAKREGKKSQVAIGDIREVLSILVALEKENLLTEDAPSFVIESAAFKKMKKK